MNEPEAITALITHIERAIERVVEAVTPLSPAQMVDPRLADSRSVKDVLAHLTWWDQWLLFTLPADQDTSPAPIAPPLADQIPSTTDWADEMNAKVYACNQARELSVIQAEFTSTRKHLLHRV